jgi:hypothetical protein
LYDTLFLYQQYAAASYCKANDGAVVGAKLDCITGNCPLVSAANTAVLLPIPTTPNTDTAGFVSSDSTNRLIAVSFRGTESWRNYITDAQVSLDSVDLCDDCEGFRGMYNAWSEVSGAIISTVKSALAANPGYTVVVTGHSLGAGIATVAAAEMRKAGIVTDMVRVFHKRIKLTSRQPMRHHELETRHGSRRSLHKLQLSETTIASLIFMILFLQSHHCRLVMLTFRPHTLSLPLQERRQLRKTLKFKTESTMRRLGDRAWMPMIKRMTFTLTM